MGAHDQIEKMLNAWAARFYGANAAVSDLKRLSGGASQETWAFDVKTDARHALILRRSPGGTERANSTAIGLVKEAALIQEAVIGGVPAPEIVHVCAPEDELGEAFIMARIAGETIARKILRDEDYSTARECLAQDCGKALAGIHAVDVGDLPDLPVSDGHKQIEEYEAIYRSFETPRPVFELALRRLKDNVPPKQPNVLVHGDFRLGNLIVNTSGLGAVLDWELAHIGDPREDLAWICVNSWRFGQSQNRVGGFGRIEDFLDAYAEAGGAHFTPQEIDWWETLGSLKWGIMCMIMYESFRTGMNPSVERAAIGRRVSETEIDLINLIEQASAHA